MAEKAKGSKTKLPLKWRLKAWWEGYDPAELEKRYLASLPPEDAPPAAPPAPKKPAEAPKPAALATTVEEIDPVQNAADRINIAQYIWGEGYCGPGGPDYIVALSKLLALSPEMSMLFLSAGLGGPARVLADKFGVWVTGYEEDEHLAAKAKELSKMAGMERKAAVEHYVPNSEFQGFDRKFDRAMAKEALYTVEDKDALIAHVEDKLKPGGLFLITDYVIAEDSVVAKENFREWKVAERSTPYMVTPKELEAKLKNVRMQVRVSEDITAQYVEMINKAWAGADEVAAKLAKLDDGARLIQVLMREAEYWTRRKSLLESGDMRLWRIVANKKAGGPSMMSDW
ncbi:methyltransferase domain-containing protein [Gimibacter soli]|uniref:Methyltransferase domain-containing protein n=1 Tax=Gimibacter soli TaxID=3024400 RepID=A0AAE9XWP1_9PROT|nr:methyltransferase domain-containing protein [Gimibacter soli]WCL54759.1 methyltransferase domain-containing protein [Gimibacter soli]